MGKIIPGLLKIPTNVRRGRFISVLMTAVLVAGSRFISDWRSVWRLLVIGAAVVILAYIL